MIVLQKIIINQLKRLDEIPSVFVTVSGEKSGTVLVGNNNNHAVKFIFKWSKDHFVGYFIDRDKKQSQAVMSIYTRLDAIQFVEIYTSLNALRARRVDHK